MVAAVSKKSVPATIVSGVGRVLAKYEAGEGREKGGRMWSGSWGM